MQRLTYFSILLMTIGGGCLDSGTNPQDLGSETQASQSPDTPPNGRRGGTRITWAKGGKGNHGQHGRGNGIYFHGGPIILGTTNAYYIWYGTWNDATERAVLTNFAENVGGSPYYNINTSYYAADGTLVSNAVAFGGETYADYSYGANLTDSDIAAIVNDALTIGGLPVDENGVYFVLTSADVTETSGFCSQYCGWHTYAFIDGYNVKYAFVGNPEQCPSACQAQTNNSPSGYLGADGMASIVAHELEEAVTDPNLDAWYDHRGFENADKCSWTFGTTYTTANGADANMNLGGEDYLIQQNWVDASGGYCALSY